MILLLVVLLASCRKDVSTNANAYTYKVGKLK